MISRRNSFHFHILHLKAFFYWIDMIKSIRHDLYLLISLLKSTANMFSFITFLFCLTNILDFFIATVYLAEENAEQIVWESDLNITKSYHLQYENKRMGSFLFGCLKIWCIDEFFYVKPQEIDILRITKN